MGRHQFEEYQPGCMWTIRNYLDYHHWNNVKKIVPPKKHHKRRQAKCWRNPRTVSFDYDNDEIQQLLDTKEDNVKLDERAAKSSPTNKSSAKARIKAMIAKEMSKDENRKHSTLRSPGRSQLQRTDSLHHLDPSDHRVRDIKSSWTNPIIILRKNPATRLQGPSLSKIPGEPVASSKAQKQMDAKRRSRELSRHQVKDCVDVFEIYGVEKDLFLKVLPDPKAGFSRSFRDQQTSNTKAKLTKSGSFPMADSSRTRNLRPSTLEHKQNETWSLTKREKLLTASRVPKIDASKSRKDNSLESVVDQASASAIKQETSFSSQKDSSSHRFDNQGRNQSVMSHLKDIKKTIKQALKESKHKSNQTSKDALLQVPRGSTDDKEMSEMLKTRATGEDGVDNHTSHDAANASEHDHTKGRLQRVRRTASLSESLDRYAQLFEQSFSKDTNLDHSESLKLTSEDKISSKRASRFCRRISSLSDLESICSLLTEVSRDAFSSEMPISTTEDCNIINTESDSDSEQKLVSVPEETHKFEPLEAVIETKVQKLMVERKISQTIGTSTGYIPDRSCKEIIKTDDTSVDEVEIEIQESYPQNEQEISCAMEPSREALEPSSVSVVEGCFRDDTTNSMGLPISEGLELNSGYLHMDEPDSSVNLQNNSNTDSMPMLVNEENIECTSKRVDCHFLHHNLDKMGDPNFNFVREVLELSGFTANELPEAWHSIDEPLNPSLLKEMEAFLQHEFQSCGDENSSTCYQQLLFDLVNGALLKIYNISYTYFPKAFSITPCTRPMPRGQGVLEEVWTTVSWYLNSRPRPDQSLDDIVAQDMAKGDGWMKLHMEAECVALDLEDLIFDQLLDEVVCS